MKLYHLTTKENAKSIIKNGFRDQAGSYGITDGNTKLSIKLKGVFFTDCVEAVSGYLFKHKRGRTVGCDSVFIVKVREKDISDHELIEKNKSYREWCIPSDMVNKYFVDRTIYSIDDENFYDAPTKKIPLSKLGVMTRQELIKEIINQKNDKYS